MAAINPISGGMQRIQPPAINTGQANRSDQEGFGKTLMKAVDGVDQSQQVSETAIQDLLAGKTRDVLPVVMAVAKADMSFKLLLGVRNKVIEAYKQTMNMQV